MADFCVWIRGKDRFGPFSYAKKSRVDVWVSKNWRLTFSFEGDHAILVGYQDYR